MVVVVGWRGEERGDFRYRDEEQEKEMKREGERKKRKE